MMSDHGANPTSFNKRKKDWTSKTLANPPPPSPTSDNFPYTLPPSPPPPPPVKVDIVCVSPSIFLSILLDYDALSNNHICK